jgi:hypothetical protein
MTDTTAEKPNLGRPSPDYARASDSSSAALVNHHLMIGGTGRAGTSFLVRYLDLCGMNTMMQREGLATWNDDANAGLENFPESDAKLPYVIKSAWFHEFVSGFFKDPTRKLDAVLVPMRDLVEAASSRIINDQVARFRDPATPSECTTWERWGTTPGGVVYSLNPLDQARILSLSFHAAIHELVRHDVPLYFLDFPRFIEDPDYLYAKLKPLLPNDCDQAKARLAHESIADTSMVRTGRDLNGPQPPRADAHTEPGITYPSAGSLNQAASSRVRKSIRPAPSLLRRILNRIRRVLG